MSRPIALWQLALLERNVPTLRDRSVLRAIRARIVGKLRDAGIAQQRIADAIGVTPETVRELCRTPEPTRAYHEPRRTCPAARARAIRAAVTETRARIADQRARAALARAASATASATAKGRAA